MRDFITNIQVKRAISPVTQTNSDTALVSQIIDRQGYDALAFIIAMGGLTDADATFAVTVDEGDASDLTGSNAVAAVDLISQNSLGALTAAGFTFASDDQVRKIGYVGGKRYVRLTITPTGNNAGAASLSVTAILAKPTLLPVTQATA